MNVLLLGNGFDIYHNLPTKYNDFLQTVDFLNKNYQTSMQTVGSIFGDAHLQAKSEHISICYHRHTTTYEKTYIDEVDIKKIINLTKDNMWFSYLLKCLNKEVGWIDFEKEISIVLRYFQEFFKNKKIQFLFTQEEAALRYIMMHFNFFIEKYEMKMMIGGPNQQVIPTYSVEQPYGSNNVVIDKEKIIQKLSLELSNFAEALKLYLNIFIDSTLDEIRKEEEFQQCLALSHADRVISFNYTNTYEKFYCDKTVFHLHGKTVEDIVLGVNPSIDDKKETIDTTFVLFKKYFQRSLIESDTEYLNWLDEIKEGKHEISLVVMGHSLDVTDEDILKELFYYSQEIIILYHDVKAKSSYIANLINIFGKDEFDEIRRSKHLKFLPLNMDFTEFSEKMRNNSYENLVKNLMFAL